MVNFTSLFRNVSAMLKEVPAASVLRERIELFKDQLELLQQRIEYLEQENSGLKKERDELAIKLSECSVSDEFIEHRGALFKRKPGGYHEAVYCPKCHVSTVSLEGFVPYSCESCRWSADFTGEQLKSIIKELPAFDH